jgi:hypothetical protein
MITPARRGGKPAQRAGQDFLKVVAWLGVSFLGLKSLLQKTQSLPTQAEIPVSVG